MSSFEAVDSIWLVGALVLAVSALAARRLSVGTIVRALFTWAAIGLVVYVVVAQRHEIGDILGRAASELSGGEPRVAGSEVRIRMSGDGHFWARTRINGIEREMLVDSGATTTAVSEETAKAANIPVVRDEDPVRIETANGVVEARRGKIADLAVGPLSTKGLEVVVSPSFGETEVLGMNFLSRLKSWRVEGRTLILDPGTAEGEDAGARE
ncbi:MAG: TIGR02281 family clan AA aspartic protease [Sphingomonas sp.]